MPQTKLDIKDEIEILLTEYNTLRAELLQRNTVTYQLVGVAATAIIGIIAFVFTQSLIGGGILLIVSPVIIWVVSRLLIYDTLNVARHVQDLEKLINEKANTRLLSWESEHGLLSPGDLQARSKFILSPFLRNR